MDQATLLRASAIIEAAAFVFLPLALLALWLATRRMSAVEPAPDTPEEPVTLREIGLLLCVLCGALLLRLLWWDGGIPGTNYGGELITMRADLALQKGGLWAHWWHLLRISQPSSWSYDSAVIQPVVVLFQLIFPPDIHGIVRVGAFFGVAAVILAWAAGRLLHGPRFGLLLAGFLAVAPLQVVWSRLGYRAIAAVPHVLAAIALATLTARRGSYLLAALTGVVGYASLHNYEAARVAIPLSLVTICAASWQPGTRGARAVGLAVALVGVIAALAATVPEGSLKATLWPNYPGYAGNQGEKNLAESVRDNAERVRSEGLQSLEDYFLVNRNSPPRPSIHAFGIQYGGLVFIPVALLGLVGLVTAGRSPPRVIVWFAVLLLGLAMPALGCSTARRLLIFDLAWCAFAAFGLVQLAQTPLLVRVPLRYRAPLAGGFLALMGAWTLAAMLILRDTPTYRGIYSVPFATGCLDDFVSCPRCVQAAREWERDIRGGKLVMLLDSDQARENPTGPAGLPLYGYLAAATAGERDRFQELYPILWGYGFTPEYRHYYENGDHATFLRTLLGGIPYRAIVWQCERPTAWDRWLANRLVAVGGRLATFNTPLADGTGFRVETDKAEEEAVLGVLASIFGPVTDDGAAPCVTARKVASEPLPFQPQALAVAEHATSIAPPTWFALAPGKLFVHGGAWPHPTPRHAVLESGRVRVLRIDGYADTYDWPSRERQETSSLIPLMPIGSSCAAFAASAWWVVDPEHGVVRSSADTEWIPKLDWMGVANDGRDELVLAAADQIVVLDVATRTERFRFPASLTPSQMAYEFGACVQLIRGSGWIGVLHTARNRLDLYRDPGRRLGTLSLDGLGLPSIWSVAGSEAFLATGQASQILTTLELDFTACEAAAPGNGLAR